MKQKVKNITIGVILYSSPGTKTSILLSEFLFFNKLAEINPDVKFVFIPVTKMIEKNTLKHVKLLNDNVDYEVLRVDKPSEFENLLKRDSFSGFFAYMLRNNFFGGAIDPRCKMAYIIASYVTNELDLPLFIRTPDSEYLYKDYRSMVEERLESKTSGNNFRKVNHGDWQQILSWNRIEYSNVYWIANGSDQIYDWAPDVLYNDVSDYLKSDDIKESLDRVLYVSDDVLFGYHEYKDLYDYEVNENHGDKICFAGFLKGSVAEKRPKILKKIFGKNETKMPVRIFGPGSTDIKALEHPNIERIEDSFQGKDYFDFLNSQMAMIHFGKGKDNYSYIAKSIYDCAIANVPSLIYLPCDQNKIIFGDHRFYFSDEHELYSLYNQLKDPAVRERFICDQREWIENTLSNKMYPNFTFSSYCEEGIYNITKLF